MLTYAEIQQVHEAQKNIYIEPDSGVQLSPSPHSVSKSSLDLSVSDDEFLTVFLAVPLKI